jgi:hypothetical protein
MGLPTGARRVAEAEATRPRVIPGPGDTTNVVVTASGYANPTLTIVVLATRLADHLKHQPA